MQRGLAAQPATVGRLAATEVVSVFDICRGMRLRALCRQQCLVIALVTQIGSDGPHKWWNGMCSLFCCMQNGREGISCSQLVCSASILLGCTNNTPATLGKELAVAAKTIVGYIRHVVAVLAQQRCECEASRVFLRCFSATIRGGNSGICHVYSPMAF